MGEGKKGINFFFLPTSTAGIAYAPGDDGSGSIPVPTPPVTPITATNGNLNYTSATTFYVSNTAGAIGYYDISWSADKNGFYELRTGTSTCSSGTVKASGAIASSTSTTNRLNASDLGAGSSTVKLCLLSPDTTTLWDDVSVTAVRDDSAPSVSFSPAGGTYGSSIPSIGLTCTDTGAAGCLKVAYRNDGTDPGLTATGSVSSGTAYSSAFAVANNATTDVKVVAVDKAGNVSSVSTSQYVVSVGNPTITINSVSKSDIRGTDSSNINWKSDLAGTYEFRIGGTNCAAGTNGSAFSTAITGSAAANTNIITNIPGADLAAGANTIRVCLTTSGSNVGSNSRTINRDDTAPAISSITIDGGPSASTVSNVTVNLNTDHLDFVFSEDMDTSLKPLPKHYDTGTSPATLVPWPTITGTWVDAQTYRVSFNGKLPEWHLFYHLFDMTADPKFKDKAGNVVAGAFIASNQIKLLYKTESDPAVIRITDTRQTSCFDAAGNTLGSCATTGQDADNSVLPYGLMVPSSDPAYPNDMITVDNVTGKTWKTCGPGYEWSAGTCVVSATPVSYQTWYDAIPYCLQLNLNNSGAGFAGKTTWRVPTLKEQMSLMTYEGTTGNEGIPTLAFPGFVRNDYQRYWTMTNAMSSTQPNVDYANPGQLSMAVLSNGTSWGAWTTSVFGGGTHTKHKVNYAGWGTWPNNYILLTMCVAD
ncbi:DUF1566 domain-containing protein [Leptospira gomenensis]|nr:DUF1566 domain-containing protein [Leptospira gomenensis]